VLSLVGVIVLSLGSFVATLLGGHSPQLGLDLQGGISVVLQPRTKVPESVLDQAIEIIRSRVDALGVAEPDISRQGSSVIVQLPGVRNKDRALELIGTTAQLYFRPVISDLPASETATPSTTTTAPATTTTTVAGATTTVPATTTTTIDTAKTTKPEDNNPANQVVLPEKDENGNVTRRYLLGPAEVNGRALTSARATVEPTTGAWDVEFSLSGSGTKEWNDMAVKVGQGNRIAIDLDGVVKSAPSLDTTDFPGKGRITGNFSQREAKDLALVLRYGALPVQLDRQTVQSVSASLGKDSLHAGIAAGIVGLALVVLYMILYYRALGIVVFFGLMLTGMFMYSIVTWLGSTNGLALTLAHARRRHRHHRVRRSHSGLLCRVLRTVERRDPVGQDGPLVGRPQLRPGLPDHPRRRRRLVHRRRRPLPAERGLGARVRLLPGLVDAARCLHRLLLHPPHGRAAGPQATVH
jgi:preprotein translocase subunit SecD